MKIFHEAPTSIFDKVQLLTDGDYALVHLLESGEYPEYERLFKQAVVSGREVILDNSIFELGNAVSGDVLAKWVEEIRPEWYIVPDALEDRDRTVNQFHDFIEAYPDLPGKRIGVLQGTSDRQLMECYEELSPYCDMIAISFDYSHWLLNPTPPSQWHSYMGGRIKFIHKYAHAMRRYMPHHLLGSALPQELRYYKGLNKAFPSLLYSIDTSNPVVHGFFGASYTREGLQSKMSIKLCDLINAEVPKENEKIIINNITAFRRFWYE